MSNKKLLEKAIDMYATANNLTSLIKHKSWIDHALGRSNSEEVEQYIHAQKALTKSLIDHIIGKDSELIVGETSFNINRNEVYKKLEKSVN